MSDPSPQTNLFRPSKKRKIYRQRFADSESIVDLPPSPPATTEDAAPPPVPHNLEAGTELDGMEGTQVSMAEILRLRKLRKHRGGGVEIRVEVANTSAPDGETQALALRGEGDGKDELLGLSDDAIVKGRFARQTGMVGDVDRHMMAYIDSELAKRLNPTTIKPKPVVQEIQVSAQDASPTQQVTSKDVTKQPTTLGKLLEIDLGNESRDKNVLLTEKARRRLDGEEVDEDETKAVKKKVRLGPDGKPWRGGRKRRGSEDVKRDKLVEEVLRENRLEMYEEPVQPTYKTGDESGSEDADDRLAEAFKREFLDAVSARQKKKMPPSGPGRTKEEEVLKGPKLGGSRSARAAMREVLLKEQQKK